MTSATRRPSRTRAVLQTSYGYNAPGELASETVVKQDGQAPAAPAAQYAGFDAKGDAEPSIGLPVTLFEYDADGNLIKELNPNGTETDTTIEAVDDQETVTNKMTATGQTLTSYFYQSDLDGWKVGQSADYSSSRSRARCSAVGMEQ